MNNTKAVCVISKEFNEDWIDFLNTFKEYDVYFFVDNNEYRIDHTSFPKVNVVQIENKESESEGFKELVGLFPHKYNAISGWDKALYYFTTINTKYDYVWFLESDVFFYSEFTLIQIDQRYQTEDLVMNRISEHKKTTPEDPYPNGWLWKKIFSQTPFALTEPFYYSLPCHNRMSKPFLQKVKEYASKFKSLYFLEAFFPSLCMHNNMTYADLSPFNPLSRPCSEIPPDWKRKMFTTHKHSFFHPIKNTKEHVENRKLISNTEKSLVHNP